MIELIVKAKHLDGTDYPEECDEITLLKIKAKHFKDTSFLSMCNCALAKAAKEQFGDRDVIEWMDRIVIGGNNYSHQWYEDEFYDDQEKAASLNYSDEVIRTIQLTPIA